MENLMPFATYRLLQMLESAGHEAYVVGGCVRDSLLGRTPKDWDITTDATPNEVKKVFENSNFKIVDTGIKHGTVSVIVGTEPHEITTYRSDGDYSDNRRPDSVTFVKNLRQDLSRRDFTINAMAYSPTKGLVDLFGGTQDLEDKQIRCVGNPFTRFEEDALRILRAMRFASELGFEYEIGTMGAMHEHKALLHNISSERIGSELIKMLIGKDFTGALVYSFPILFEIIPEMELCHGFQQNNPHHVFDVFFHSIAAVDALPQNLTLRLTMLLHDIAKPQHFTLDDAGIGHFYGHAESGASMAREILTRLRFDNKTVSTVATLIKHHDNEIAATHRSIKRWLNKLDDIEMFRLLLEVKRADAKTQAPVFREEKMKHLEKVESMLAEILNKKDCFAIRDLTINGNDVMALGVPQGKQVGNILKKAMEEVISGTVANDRHELLLLIEQLSYEMRN